MSNLTGLVRVMLLDYREYSYCISESYLVLALG